jgi:ATP-binding cassette subfamily C protein
MRSLFQISRLAKLKPLLTDVLHQSPGRIVYVLSLMILSSLSSGIGILLIVPLLASVDISLGTDTATPGIQAHINHVFDTLGLQPGLEVILLIYLSLIVTVALINYLNAVAGAKLQRDFVINLRRQVYGSLLNANWQYLGSKRMSDFARLVTGQVQSIGFTVFQIITLTSKLVLVVVYLGLSFWLSPAMTFLALICALLLVVVLFPLNNRIQHSGHQELEAHSDIFHNVFEQLQSLKIIKSFSAESRYVEKLDRSSHLLENQQVRITRFSAFSRFIFLTGAAVIFTLLFWVALRWIHLPIANLILLLFIFSRLMPQLSAIQGHLQQLIHAAPEYQDLLAHCQDLQEHQEQSCPDNVSISLHRQIRVEGLGYQYPGKTQTLFNGLNATLQKNETLAITGPSGAGKSTLADLIAGLLPPTEGRIYIDDLPLDANTRLAWRKSVAYVTQEVFLFNDSIRANLEWVRKDPVSDEEIWHYLGLAAADFVKSLPHQLDTRIGDRGTQLSGGERQRLALARALIAQPALLILDEATSALDRDNEARIRQALMNLEGKLTLIVIAHDQESIAHIHKRIELGQPD